LITPTLNFIYADTDGNIGYHAAGRVPIRKGGDGTLPAEGWSGQAEWQAWIPFHQLPHTYNPPEHYLVNANNCPISDKYPYFLGCQWAPSYRAQRITGLIQEHEKMSLHDHMAIQGDTVSLQAREYLPHLLPAVQPESPEEELAIQLLTHWDHNMQGDSPAATIFAAWLLQLPKAILENILEEDLLDRYQEFYTFTSRFLLSTLLTRSKGAPAGSDPAEPDRLEQAIANAFRAALKLLRKRLGGAPDTWRWSRLHTVVLPHQPFHKVRPLRLLFSRTVPQGGDWSTVNCGAFNPTFQQSLIAGYRQIIDLSNQDGSVYIQTSGQSGHLLSPHYDDYLADWKNIHYRKMRFTRSSVSAGQRARLWLTPHPAIPRERMTDLGAADHQ
jgi:penicillin amidase